MYELNYIFSIISIQKNMCSIKSFLSSNDKLNYTILPFSCRKEYFTIKMSENLITPDTARAQMFFSLSALTPVFLLNKFVWEVFQLWLRIWL